MLLSSPIISFCQDHVIFMRIHLTGVSCPLFKFFSSYQVLHLFSTGVLPEFLILIPSLSSFNRSGFNIYLITKPLGTRRIPCSSFLTECFQLCSSLLFSFFHFAQPLKVHGFSRLSKKQFSLPLIILFLFPPVPS